MSLTIKTEFKRSNGEVDIRRTRLAEGSNRYEQLINYLDSTYGQLYGIERSSYALSYVDPDGDSCSINSDAELLECCRCAEEDKKTAKIQVKVADDMSASSISQLSVSRSVSQASSRAEAPSPINASVSVSQPGSNPQPAVPEVDSDSEYVQVDTSRPATPRPATPLVEPVPVEVKPAVSEAPAPVADKPIVPSVTVSSVTVEDVTEDDREENALVEAIMATFSSAPNVEVIATTTESQKPNVVPSVFTTVTSNVTEVKDESKVDSSNSTSSSVVNDGAHYGIVCDGCSASPIVGDRFKCTICHDFDLCSKCENSGNSFGRHANTHSMIKISAAGSQPRFAPVRPTPPTVTPAQPASDVHAGVSCDVCGVAPIVGIRYKCTACHNYDMCASCEAKNQHDSKHVLLKFRQHLTGADVQNAILNRVSHWWRRGGPHGHGSFAGPNTGHPGPHPGHHHRWARCGRGRAEFGAAAGAATGAEDNRPRASFVSESLSDGSVVAPGSTFQKVWQIQNTGDKAWPEGCSLVFVNGDLTAADQSGRPVEHTTNSVPVSAQPGEVVTVKIDVQAPQEEGRFRSTFRLMTKEQERFGPRMWIDVEVKAPTTAALSARSEPVSSTAQTMPVAEPVQDPIRGAIQTLVSALGSQGGGSPVASFLDLIQGHGRNTPRAESPAPAAQPEHFAYQAELATIREMGIDATDETLKRLLTRYNGSVPRTVSQLFEESN